MEIRQFASRPCRLPWGGKVDALVVYRITNTNGFIRLIGNNQVIAGKKYKTPEEGLKLCVGVIDSLYEALHPMITVTPKVIDSLVEEGTYVVDYMEEPEDVYISGSLSALEKKKLLNASTITPKNGEAVLSLAHFNLEGEEENENK
jgi:hypothetical protein